MRRRLESGGDEEGWDEQGQSMRELVAFWVGMLVFVALIPLFSVVIIWPLTFIFGAAKWLYYVEMVAIYGLSAASAVWVARRI